MNRMNGMFSLCRVVAIGAIFTFTLSSTLQGQTMVTATRTVPYQQNWDTSNMNPWSVSPDGGGAAVVQDRVITGQRGHGNTLSILSDFRDASTAATFATSNFLLPTNMVSLSNGMQRAIERKDITVSFDLWTSEAANVNFVIYDGDTLDALTHTLNNQANMWNEHSFTIPDMMQYDSNNNAPFDFGSLFDGTADEMEISYGAAAWGQDTLNEIRIDNFSIQVPEPEQYALIALALCGLVIFAKRRTQTKPTTLQS